MEDIIDIIVTETTNLIEITSQPTDEIIDVNIIDNREDVTLNVTPTLVEININSLTGNFGILWGEIEGTLSNQTDLQNALNLKADLVGGKVPSSQLPSYVDDVVEVANYAALPATGETGKIYVTIDTNYIYRWTGSVYVEIKDSSAVWGAITGTLSNQTDLQNALNAKLNLSGGTLTGGLYINPANSSTIGLDVASNTFRLRTDSSEPFNRQLTTTIGSGTLVKMQAAGYGATYVTDLGFYTSSGSAVNTTPNLYLTGGDNRVGVNTTTPSYSLDVQGTAGVSGNLTAGAIIKSGGTSSQFLKADGSVDSNTYLTTSSASSSYVPYTGANASVNLGNNNIEINGTTAYVRVQGGGASGFISESAGAKMQLSPTSLFLTEKQSSPNYTKTLDFRTSILGASYTIIVPDASGTLALTSQLHNAVTIGTANGLTLSTQVLSLGLASSSANGALSSTDWTTFNGKQNALSGTGFVKISGSTITYDNSTYLTTGSAASTYLPLTGGTLTGDLTLSSTNPRLYFTDTDNNPDYFISNTDGTFTVYDVTNSTARFTIGTTGNGIFGGNLTVGQIIRSGGTSAQFLKADGSVDSSTYLTTSSASSTYLALAGGTLTGAVTGTRMVLVQNSADIALSIVQSGTGRGLSVLGTSYFSTDIQLGYATNAILKTTSLGVITSAIAGTDYVIPSALSSYLPLSGGTLTGALSGTSATFSGALTVTNNVTIRPTSGYNAYFQTSGTSVRINYLNDALSANVGAAFRATDYSFQDGTGSPVFSIASTGAATFSSSVTAGSTSSGANINAYVSSYGNNGLFQSFGTDGNLKLQMGALGTNEAFIYTGASNKLSIYTGGSTSMTITSSGNVGIGTTSPTGLLHLYGSDPAFRIQSSTTGNMQMGQWDGTYNRIQGSGRDFILINTDATNMLFSTNSTERMRITSGGQVQIKEAGGTHTSDGLSLINTGSNTWNLVNAGDNFFYFGYNGTSKAMINPNNGSYGALSDKNKKEEIELSNIGLSEIMQLKPSLYRFKDNKDNNSIKELGFIAQEVKDCIPNAYVESGEFIGLNYNPIVAALTKAVQELKAELDTLKNK